MQPAQNVRIRAPRGAARITDRRRGPSRAPVVVVGMVLMLAGLAGPVRGGELPVRRWDWNEVRNLPGGEDIVARELQRQGEYNRRWHIVHDVIGGQHVSRRGRDLLSSQGLGPALVKRGSPRTALATADDPDTLRVLLVRIAFETNREPSLTTISGSGDFMLEPLADPGPIEIDPPPHNKAYFESHLEGLSEYYRFMSGGRLHIEGAVLPAGDADSYKLTDVADYGPGAGAFWSLESLERLVQDSITAADQGLIADGLVNGLSDYDDESPFTYVIFVHAGSDWQSDINGDSPNDIPTFFVSLGEPVDLAGTNPAGNPGRLGECSIIPETTNQDGFPGSIAAAFYHEFGHALGLPDVYNTETGLPSVGIWDLMDSGTNLPVTLGAVTAEDDTVFVAATGVLPPSLSAWCKMYLGWLDVAEVSEPISTTGDYLLPAVGVPREQYGRYNAGFGDFNLAYPQAYRAGLSPREYFLIENRWVPDNPGQTPFLDLRFEQDDDTDVVKYLAGLTQGGWENSGLYDYFMPAGGLLVWHVNDDRIAANLDDNTINAVGDGLRLVEADGIQDIGILDAYVLGWFGSHRDPFGGKDLDGNFTGYNDLYVSDFPSSRNFDRSFSGLRLTDMEQRVPRTASVMKFRASLAPVREGFPWEADPVGDLYATAGGGTPGPRAVDTSSLTPLDLGGEQVLVFADEPGPTWDGPRYVGMLFGLRPDGSPRWEAVANGPEGAFQVLGAQLAGPPAAVDHPTDGKILLWGTVTGMVGATHLPGGATPSQLWSVDVGDTLTCAPRVVRASDGTPRLLVAAPSDSLRLIDAFAGGDIGDPIAMWSGPGDPISTTHLASLPVGENEPDQALLLTEGFWTNVRIGDSGLFQGAVQQEYDFVPQEVPTWPAVRPLSDGALEVGIYGPEGELSRSVIRDGNVVSHQTERRTFDGPVVTAPAIADVDGDGRHDMLVATRTRLYGFKDDGVPLRGFPVVFRDLYPLADSTGIAGPLVVADATGDGAPEVFFNTTGGHLVGLDATGRLLDGLPVRWGDRTDLGLAVGGEGSARILWLASAGGYRTGFQDRQVAGGRVSAWDFVPGTGAEGRSGEWLGPAGGPDRRGVQGEARSLGAAAPIAAEVAEVYLYPNPLRGDDVKVRFYSGGSGSARLAVYNLSGELVATREGAVTPDAVNELTISLPGVASGLYVAKLEYAGTQGREIRTLTLAVEK